MSQKRSPAKHSTGQETRVQKAIRLLAEEAEERLKRKAQGQVSPGDWIDLELSVPIGERGLDEAFDGAEQVLEAAVDGAVRRRAAIEPGRVFCLRCANAECEHSELPDPRQVFSGYGATGLPTWKEFGQSLLDRGDERISQLWGPKPRVLSAVAGENDLVGSVLDQYRDRASGVRIHGQVTAGWYSVPGADGLPFPIALTFQIVSSRPPGQRARLGLNLIGLGPGGEPLEHLYHRIGESPWGGAARWAREAVSSVERQLHQKGSKKAKARRKAVTMRLEGILGGLARRLEKDQRARGRRTRHGEQRHATGDRPTRMALADLARARDEDILVDVRRRTLIVLGERGRTHVFSSAGKLVTSIRFDPPAIERRRKRGQWRPARTDDVRALRERVEGAQSAELRG